MNYKLFWFLILALFVSSMWIGINGCSERNREYIIDYEKKMLETLKRTLPTDVIDIRDLGNGWVTFKLQIQGAEHTFLYYRSGNAYSGYALTEIK